MIALVQRVAQARVEVDGVVTGAIDRGLLVLMCAEPADGPAQVTRLLDKLLKLRVFSDAAGKMNLSLQDVQGGLLIVSQFTLAADTSTGNRPSFIGAAPAERGVRSTRTRCAWRASGTRWCRPASLAPTCACTWSTTGRSPFPCG